MPTLGVGSFSEAHADLNVESDLLVSFDRTRKREREKENTRIKKERKKKKRSTGKRNEERTCTPRLETAPPSPLFSPKAHSTLSSRTEIHTSRTSRARPCVIEEREREKIKFARVTLAKKKKNILHPHSLLKGRALLRFEFETKTKRKQKKFSHASVIALAEALSPLFAKSSIIFVYALCVFLFSLSFFFFLLFVRIFCSLQKNFSLFSSLFCCFFGHVGVEFLRNFRNPKTRKKGLPKLSKNKRTRSL